MGNIVCCCGGNDHYDDGKKVNNIDLNKIKQTNQNNSEDYERTCENELIISAKNVKANPNIQFDYSNNTTTKESSLELNNEIDFNRNYYQETTEGECEKLDKTSQIVGTRVKKIITFTKLNHGENEIINKHEYRVSVNHNTNNIIPDITNGLSTNNTLKFKRVVIFKLLSDNSI